MSDLSHNFRVDAKCPKCANTQGIHDGGPTLLLRFRAYDVLTDSFGLLRCPHCGFKGGAAAFEKAAVSTLVGLRNDL